MQGERNRRELLGLLGRGFVASLLALVPGSLLNRGLALAAEEEKKAKDVEQTRVQVDTLEGVFAKTKKADVYTTVRGAELPAEDKLAVVAVREIKEAELRRCLTAVKQGGSVGREGHVCGTNCGSDCGSLCGVSCSGMSRGALGVIDRKGKLGLSLKGLDVQRFTRSSEKLLALP
jgi:hypothetical protein